MPDGTGGRRQGTTGTATAAPLTAAASAIAERLQISEKTVRNHASNLFDKLGVRSRAQAIVFAREHGYTS